MSQEMCELSLQQIQELLRFVDTTLKNICCRKFNGEDLYLEAMQKVLGGQGRRGPAALLMVFLDRDGAVRHGRIFHLTGGRIVERSAEITIDPLSAYAASLEKAGYGDELVVLNGEEVLAAEPAYQSFFPPEVIALVGSPVRNFIVQRMSGDTPGVIAAFNYPGKANDYDAAVLKSLSVVIASVVTLAGGVGETEKAFIYTIEALARACEAAEEHTGQHIVRVNRYAGALAANMGLPGEFIETVSYSAQMHDVGKIRVPNAILLKEGALTEDEMRLMKMHPFYGEQILGDSPRLRIAREIAISHHENWDGSGYPYNLRGDAIPLAGRIVKIADVYDALRSRRSYKKPLSHQETLEIFRSGDERINPAAHFDPTLLQTFFKIEHIFALIYTSVSAEIA
jgi:HD-GYP domain-containing protein (c-di-GMP phosphodiesterase class II)